MMRAMQISLVMGALSACFEPTMGVENVPLTVGFASKGVRLEVASVGSGDPIEAFQQIRVTYQSKSFLLTDLAQLRGYVHIQSPKEALTFVRLRTALTTFYLWRNHRQEVEIVPHHSVSGLPNFGRRFLLGAEDFDSGFLGALDSQAYRKGGFSPPKVERVNGGFRITRWVYSLENTPKRKIEEFVSLVHEVVSEDGDYHRSIVQKKKPPALPHTKWGMKIFS